MHEQLIRCKKQFTIFKHVFFFTNYLQQEIINEDVNCDRKTYLILIGWTWLQAMLHCGTLAPPR